MREAQDLDIVFRILYAVAITSRELLVLRIREASSQPCEAVHVLSTHDAASILFGVLIAQLHQLGVHECAWNSGDVEPPADAWKVTAGTDWCI